MTLPTLILNPDGSTADANTAALELLRLTLDELRALPPGALSPEAPDPAADEAFREEWKRQGSPDLSGEGTIRRLDGSEVRVKFGITPTDDGRFVAIMEEVATAVEAPPVLYTAGQVLAHWRAAERRLAEIPEGSAEWQAVTREIETFRSRYHALFDR
ncbi:MAG TPA: PAS domain-containing protein [Candidatus Limnocylindrales bacterium]|nr:PAS domain-containing protein [Candidatus Limnocylindrales bacterium]